jgi:hypothetical protein
MSDIPAHDAAVASYKEQLGKFMNLIMVEKVEEETGRISEKSVVDTHHRIVTAAEAWSLDDAAEALAELRANALVSGIGNRRHVVELCVKHDVLTHHAESFLKIDHPKLTQSTLSIM